MMADLVLEIIRSALHAASDPRINAVTKKQGPGLGQAQLAITTDDGVRRQVWILDAASLLETDDDQGGPP